MSYIRKKASEGLEIGDTFSVQRTFTEKDVCQFAEISRDYNPVHFNEGFARVKKFDGCISHGLLVASLITEIGGQIGWLASGMSFNFKKPVYFGDTINCHLTIVDIDERRRARAEAILTNEKNSIILEAVLTGIVPGEKEKKVLKDMLTEGDPTNKFKG
jgi:3-hydroxybutyryl-CoA dehydratase